MGFCDTREWKIGDDAQKRWAAFVSSRGGIVVPVYGFDGNVPETKAPMLICRNDLLVSPDLLVLRGEVRKWNEVKAKAKPTWRRLHPGPRWEHGFDFALIDEYRTVASESGCSVYIVVHELHSPANASSESPLNGPERWLVIEMERAVSIGTHRPEWPGGAANQRRRGRNGKGGLLWARNAMTTISLDLILKNEEQKTPPPRPEPEHTPTTIKCSDKCSDFTPQDWSEADQWFASQLQKID